MDRITVDDCGGSGFSSILDRIRSDNEENRVQSAKEIRRLTKTSSRNRRLLAGAVEPLVSMLRAESAESNEAAILALLNLAVKDERYIFWAWKWLILALYIDFLGFVEFFWYVFLPISQFDIIFLVKRWFLRLGYKFIGFLLIFIKFQLRGM